MVTKLKYLATKRELVKILGLSLYTLSIILSKNEYDVVPKIRLYRLNKKNYKLLKAELMKRCENCREQYKETYQNALKNMELLEWKK